MTKQEEERLAVVETKIDSITQDVAEIKKNTDNFGIFCAELSQLKLRFEKVEDKQDKFINKNGFITASIILGILLSIFSIIQWIR